ncbi:MAG: ATP-binding protein [Crenarchaeota archaeon]|nr:ATP-binding protein [Thermoproteota archaeon]
MVDDLDLTGLISFLDFLSQKSGCEVKLVIGVKRRAVAVEVCCLKSPKLISVVRSKLVMISGLKVAHCLSRGDGRLFGVWPLGGKVCLGREVFTGAPFCLDERKMRRHVLIVGSTGSGKSTTAKKIFRELGTAKVVLDWHGEYKGLALTIDCISLTKLKSLGKLELLDVFSNSLKLSDAQYYLLLKIIQLLYNKNKDFGIRDVIFYLKSLEEVSRWIRESKYSLLRKLEMLTHKEVCRYSVTDVPQLVKDGLVIDLSSYTTEYAKRFVAHAVLAYIFTEARRGMLERTYVFLEEAHNIIPKSSELGIADKVFMEGRKYGVHLVAITQSPKALNENAVKNSYTKIIHMLREVDDAKYMAENIGDPGLWKEFIELEVGEAIVSQRRPVRVLIDST